MSFTEQYPQPTIAIPLGSFNQADHGWQITTPHKEPKGTLNITENAGGHYAEVHYDFTDGGQILGISTALPEFDFKAIRFQLKKPLLAYMIFWLTDSSGIVYEKTLFYQHEDWQQVCLDMDGWKIRNRGITYAQQFKRPFKQFDILVCYAPNMEKIERFCVGSVEMLAESGKSRMVAGCYDLAFLDESGSWSEVPLNSKPSRVRYDLSSEKQSVNYNANIAMHGSANTIRVQGKGGYAGHKISLILQSHFQTLWRELGVLDGGDFYFEVPVPPEGWQWSGGENDGLVRYPLMFQGLRITAEEGGEPTGQLENVVVSYTSQEELRKAIKIVAMKPEISKQNGSINACVSVHLWSLLPTEVSGEIILEALSWDNKALKSVSAPVTLPAGSKVTKEIMVNHQFEGRFVEYKATFMTNGLPLAIECSAYTEPMLTDGPWAMEEDSIWGVGLYNYRQPNTPEGRENLLKSVRLAASAGVKWTREEFNCEKIEKSKGVYDWSHMDYITDISNQHGISVYALIDYWPPFVEPYTEEGIESYIQYTKALVTHFKDRIRHYEIWNEPNIFFWSGPKEMYADLLRRAYDAIKEVDPTAQVMGCSICGMATQFVSMCIEKGAKFDELTIHPYRWFLEDQELLDDLMTLWNMVDRKPMWLTEIGWASNVGENVDLRRQAEILGRTYLISAGSGACANVSWYDFRNDGHNVFYNEANFGTTYYDYTPKPSFSALATICNNLPSPKNARRIAMQKDVFCFTFDTLNGKAIVLWTKTCRCFSVRVIGEDIRYLNLMGEDIHPYEIDGETWLMLQTHSPVLILGAEDIEYICDPLEVSSNRSAESGTSLDVALRADERVAASVSWQIIPSKNCQAAPIQQTSAATHTETPKREWRSAIQLPAIHAPHANHYKVVAKLDTAEFIWVQDIDVVPAYLKI